MILTNHPIRINENINKFRIIQEKIKTISMTIQKNNLIDKNDNPILYKSSWKNVYKLSAELRNSIDEYVNNNNDK